MFSPRFNNRRYNKVAPGGVAGGGEVLGDLEPVDNCINSVLGQVSDWIIRCTEMTYDLFQEVELTDEFKANYEKWLDKEVYSTQIEWDSLLAPSYH